MSTWDKVMLAWGCIIVVSVVGFWLAVRESERRGGG